MPNFNPMLLADFYKIGHIQQYPEGTETIYSTWTPRMSRMPDVDKVVAFSIQWFAKGYLIDYFNENFFNRKKSEVVKEYVRTIKHTLFVDEVDATHIAELHDLGYLPIRLRAVKEGTLVPLRVPMLTLENTHPKFFWLTNYFETMMSACLWQPMTSATTSYRYREILDAYAMKTVGNTDHVQFQAHDFSMRGMAGVPAGAASGAGHLLSFVGTDTIPAISFLEAYYGADIEKELVGTSIPATEHSVMSANSDPDERDELESFRRLVEDVYPNGFVSIVSDTYDFWKVVGEILPALKNSIMARDGKVVIRPDSGDPVEILCGTGQYLSHEDLDIYEGQSEDEIESQLYEYLSDLWAESKSGKHDDGEPVHTVEYRNFDGQLKRAVLTVKSVQHYEVSVPGDYDLTVTDVEETLESKGLIQALYELFGGTVNELGYKVLDPHIGAIYGDSITHERAEEILKRLEAKGFASSNVVLGIGSYSFQMTTRDTFGFAMKATYAVVGGEEKMLFKDPKTDDGMKRSQRGRVYVINDEEEGIVFVDGLVKADEEQMAYPNLLEDVFVDGKLVRDESLAEIRERLMNQSKKAVTV